MAELQQPQAAGMPERLPWLDVARGIAVVLMIEAHAYHAWVDPALRVTAAYRVTRVLALIPAPLFVLLAGVGIALAEQRSDPSLTAAGLRQRFVRRGLRIWLAGYALSFAYALIDGGWRPTVLLRSDILHAIGLSIVLLATLCVGRSAPALRAAALAGVACCVQPLVGTWPAHWSAGRPWAPLVALGFDVPRYTQFPVFPMLAFAAMGYALVRSQAIARLDVRRGLMLVPVASLTAIVATKLTDWAVASTGGVFARTQWSIVPNIAAGAAASCAVLGAARVLDARLTHAGASRMRSVLTTFGKHSLTAYAFHIPFCYGMFGRPLQSRLDMLSASGAYVALCALTYGAVLLWRSVLAWRASRHVDRLVVERS